MPCHIARTPEGNWPVQKCAGNACSHCSSITRTVVACFQEEKIPLVDDIFGQIDLKFITKPRTSDATAQFTTDQMFQCSPPRTALQWQRYSKRQRTQLAKSQGRLELRSYPQQLWNQRVCDHFLFFGFKLRSSFRWRNFNANFRLGKQQNGFACHRQPFW